MRLGEGPTGMVHGRGCWPMGICRVVEVSGGPGTGHVTVLLTIVKGTF